MMTHERRKNARIRLAVEVEITSGSNFYAARTRDISTGGLFVETPVALPVGAPIEIELSLTGNRHSIRAEVAWVLGGSDGTTEGVGVRFPSDDKSKLLKVKIEEILGGHLASERPTQTI